MTTWREFTEGAPRIGAIFTRRQAATGNLCMLATLRLDGFPRISPIEPRACEHQLWIVGMPGTTKFRDLRRDPRFCLHTATIDTEVTDGDAKVWGVVDDIQDKPYSNGLPRHCSRTPGLTFGDWTSTTSMLPT